MNDEHFFEIASDEIKSGRIRPGLRAKAFSDARGDGPLAQALYLKYRVAQLVQEERQGLRAKAQEEKQNKRQEQTVEETEQQARAKEEGLTSMHVILLGLFAMLIAAVIKQLL